MTPYALPPGGKILIKDNCTVIQGGILITGPSGEIRLSNDEHGLFIELARLNSTIASGFIYSAMDDVPGHWYGWCPDWASQNLGDYLAFYDSKINNDIIGLYHRGPHAGLCQIGVLGGTQFGPPAQLNLRPITTEIDQLKERIAQLEKALLAKQQPQAPQ